MASSTPVISVVICTCNREKYLADALQSLWDQSLRRDKFEIIVVDSSSTDNTKAICGRFADTVYIYDPSAGLSRARNTGWRSARGDFVAYLDDDAVASNDWLELIIKSFSFGSACVGGKVIPIWEVDRPAWLPDSLLWYLSILEWNLPRHVLGEREYLNGANIAFRRNVLEMVGGFREDLGRAYVSNSRLLGGEEIDLQVKLTSRGQEVVYDPTIIVRHVILAQRLHKDWFLKRAFWQGVTDAVGENLSWGDWVSELLRASAGTTIRTFSDFVPKLFSHDEGTRFKGQCDQAARMGYVYGMCGRFSQFRQVRQT
ncbi:MAG TPA: glycosyltransferase [Candidatus Acidoferrum sp.]|nr:glycosyltransferase [Candidatus Acidoferrum sp.]